LRLSKVKALQTPSDTLKAVKQPYFTSSIYRERVLRFVFPLNQNSVSRHLPFW